jgi:hypothetical protein
MIIGNLDSHDLVCAIYSPDGLPDGYTMSSNAFQWSNKNSYSYSYYFWYSTGNDANSDCSTNINNNIEYGCQNRNSPNTYDKHFNNLQSGTTVLSNSGTGRYVFFQDKINVDSNGSTTNFNFGGTVCFFLI